MSLTRRRLLLAAAAPAARQPGHPYGTGYSFSSRRSCQLA